MKKGFGVLELLIVALIAVVIFVMTYNSQYGRKNPFDDNSNAVDYKKSAIETKIKDIEHTKEIKSRIEQNLNKGF